ncbi:ATP-dependent DNA helicase [Vibrio phage vB_VcorM_GR28A]|nr:ATP-dependent DNA helicase [Vibrio phage vB_VcorM_GR28A]
MSYSFAVERVSATRMRVHSEHDCIHEELDEFFRFDDPKYDPTSYRHRNWDGMTRLYSKKTGLIDIGLLYMVLKFAKVNKYKVEVDPRLNHLRRETKDTLSEYIDSLDLSRWGEDGEAVPLTPWDYQYKGVYEAVKFRRRMLLAATGAGKSLMLYLMVRYWLDEAEADENDAKLLLVVPSQMLCKQMLENFVEYSQFNGWNAEANTHLIYDGAAKMTRKRVVVSTWQGIKDEDPDWFKQFTHLAVDEAHLAAGDCITKICKSCVNAEDRIGMTATLKDMMLHSLQCCSHFGQAVRVISTKELQDLGQAAQTQITVMNLDYTDECKKQVKGLDYQGEIEAIMNHEGRNRFAATLARSLEGNTLVLFDRLDHVEAVKAELEKHHDKVHVISGSVKQDVRDQVKKIVEGGDGFIILATYGTMSTGVSIKRLHNLIFAHPSKSIIRILQSIGRSIRMHSTKKLARIFDLVDNFTVGKHTTYSMGHAKERFKYYMREEHPTKMKRYELKDALEDSIAANIRLESDARIARREARKLAAKQ